MCGLRTMSCDSDNRIVDVSSGSSSVGPLNRGLLIKKKIYLYPFLEKKMYKFFFYLNLFDPVRDNGGCASVLVVLEGG